MLLVVIASFLAVEMKSLLLGEAATLEHQERIVAALEAPEGVDRVIHSRTMHLGPEELLVAAKLAVGATDSARDVARTIDEAEQRARDAVPELTLVMYLEPDVDRAAPRCSRRPEPRAGLRGLDGGTEPSPQQGIGSRAEVKVPASGGKVGRGSAHPAHDVEDDLGAAVGVDRDLSVAAHAGR